MKDSITGIIDVGSKPIIAREAVATGLLHLSPASLDIVTNGRSPKGDVREASTIAVIQRNSTNTSSLPSDSD